LPQELKTVIRDYYTGLQHAFKTKDLEPVKQCLAEHATLIGIHEFFEGKESILEMFGKFIFMIGKLDIQRQYFDHESSCTVMDIVTIIPEIRVSHVEWVVVKYGQVIEINTVYDTKAWQKFMQLMQNRNSG
jgi:hypothetical protein